MSKKSSNRNSNEVKNDTVGQVKKIFNNLNKSQRVTNFSKDKSKPVDEKARKWAVNEKVVKLFEDSINNELGLKNKYAVILIIILAIQLVALNVIFILTGLGIFKYSDVSFNLFITGGIAEVFVLVRVIVKHLFNNNLADALNIILDRNNQGNISNYKNNVKKSNFDVSNEINNDQEQN